MGGGNCTSGFRRSRLLRPRTMATSLIGLGSNCGPRRETLDRAAAMLADEAGIESVRCSAPREYAPVGGPAGQPAFLNAAALIETSLPARALLDAMHGIEARLGRRRGERWGPRAIDLDLLLYEDAVSDDRSLRLPHPRMAFRRFVLEPAAEVAGAMVHPRIGWTVARLLDLLDRALPYIALAGGIGAGKTRCARQVAAARGARLVEERIDEPRRSRFYADSASHAWTTELEFLGERIDTLRADRPEWTGDAPAVSDFWFGQSRALARVWLPPEQQEAFDCRFEEARQRVVAPKLIVLLDLPGEVLRRRVECRGRAYERGLGADRLEAIRRSVRAEAALPGQGPLLHLETDNADEATAEVLAAIDAMEPRRG